MTIIISQAIPSDAASISLINSETWFDIYRNEVYGITDGIRVPEIWMIRKTSLENACATLI